jgi:hypothetical protein
MEMIKQMEILRDMHAVEGLADGPGKKHQSIQIAAGA